MWVGDGIGGSICRLVPARLGGMRCMPPQSDHSDEMAQTTASSASDRGARMRVKGGAMDLNWPWLLPAGAGSLARSC